MVKKNKLLIGCLALLLVLSVGYALFSETITINGTATAKGDFDITPSCSTEIPDYIIEQTNHTQNGYKNETCTVNGNVITASTSLEYPSAFKLFYTEYKNTGSISAVIKFQHSVPESMINAKATTKLYDKETDQLHETIIGSHDGYGRIEIAKFYVRKADGTILHTREELTSNNKVYADPEGEYFIEIEPNESLIFVPIMGWDDDAIETNYYSVTEMNVDLNFMQKPNNLELKTGRDAPEFCHHWC